MTDWSKVRHYGGGYLNLFDWDPMMWWHDVVVDGGEGAVGGQNESCEERIIDRIAITARGELDSPMLKRAVSEMHFRLVISRRVYVDAPVGSYLFDQVPRISEMKELPQFTDETYPTLYEGEAVEPEPLHIGGMEKWKILIDGGERLPPFRLHILLGGIVNNVLNPPRLKG